MAIDDGVVVGEVGLVLALHKDTAIKTVGAGVVVVQVLVVVLAFEHRVVDGGSRAVDPADDVGVLGRKRVEVDGDGHLGAFGLVVHVQALGLVVDLVALRMLVVDKDHHGGRADEHGRQSAYEDGSHCAEATGSRESLDELVCARTALAVGSQRLARGLQLVNAALVAQAVGQHVEHDAAGKGEHKVHLAHTARIHGQCLAKQGQVHLDPAYERIVGYGV